MKANLSLYNAIFNIWMLAIHPPWHIRVTSVDLWTNSCQFPSCLALKTIPFCFELVVTFCPSCVVLVSIRCIKSDVARTFRSICRRKALDFLRLFGDGYFKESGVWLWPILPDRNIMKESFHKKCGQRQDLHFHVVCRLSRKLICAASISLLFICTDCQRDFMRTSSFPCFKWKQSQFRGITRKKQLCFWHFILRANSHSWVGIYRLNHNKFVFNWSMFPNGTLLPLFSVENAIILWTNLKWNTQKTQPTKMVVSNWMRPHRVVWSVSNRASVCRHTYFASSANEFPWALTLEFPKHICTSAAILGSIA